MHVKMSPRISERAGDTCFPIFAQVIIAFCWLTGRNFVLEKYTFIIVQEAKSERAASQN
jgi:hypothetical protein